jgi:predicted CoA-substrate-specific enzyme activase
MGACFLGLDIGSVSTKGVIINDDNKIIASNYLMPDGSAIDAVKKLLISLRGQIGNSAVHGAGTTGSARKLIGAMVSADVVKNEITAHAIGTTSIYPDVRTILEIGGQDSKIIHLTNGVITDYAMNTLCAAGTGAFLTSQAKRLGLEVSELGALSMKSRRTVNIAARCAVFAESDLVHKIQAGYKREDIIAGLCSAVVENYLNNLCKGKRLNAPFVFQGGVSKNMGVVSAFEKSLGKSVLVDENGHLMGALGAAILSKKARKASGFNGVTDVKKESGFNFDILKMKFETKGEECNKCPNRCEIISFYKDGKLVDVWGRRCDV